MINTQNISNNNNNTNNTNINNQQNAGANNGNIENTIIFYVYYPEVSIGCDAIIIEKQMEIAILSNLKQINIGLYNISKNDTKTISVIDSMIANAKTRLTQRYIMEKTHIENLYVNLIHFNDNDFKTMLDVLLYDTYFFPKKQENKKDIKGNYSFVLLNDGYDGDNVVDNNKQNNPNTKHENKIIQTIKHNLNPNIIFTKISFNENVKKISSTYIRNIAVTNNYEKFDTMMMKLGYNKKNTDEILNVIQKSSNVMTMGDIVKNTTSMMKDFGVNITSKLTDMINNSNNTNNKVVNGYGNGKVSYAIYGGYKKRKTTKRKTTKRKTLKRKKQKNKN